MPAHSKGAATSKLILSGIRNTKSSCTTICVE